MSKQLIDSHGKAHFVCRNLEWMEFAAWAGELDPDEFPDVLQLVESGYAELSSDLARQLQRALRRSPPDLPEVLNTGWRIVQVLRQFPPYSDVAISGGFDEEDYQSDDDPDSQSDADYDLLDDLEDLVDRSSDGTVGGDVDDE